MFSCVACILKFVCSVHHEVLYRAMRVTPQVFKACLDALDRAIIRAHISRVYQMGSPTPGPYLLLPPPPPPSPPTTPQRPPPPPPPRPPPHARRSFTPSRQPESCQRCRVIHETRIQQECRRRGGQCVAGPHRRRGGSAPV